MVVDDSPEAEPQNTVDAREISTSDSVPLTPEVTSEADSSRRHSPVANEKPHNGWHRNEFFRGAVLIVFGTILGVLLTNTFDDMPERFATLSDRFATLSERVNANGIAVRSQTYGATAAFLVQIFPDDPELGDAVQLVEEGKDSLNGSELKIAADKFDEARPALADFCSRFLENVSSFVDRLQPNGATSLTDRCGQIEFVSGLDGQNVDF